MIHAQVLAFSFQLEMVLDQCPDAHAASALPQRQLALLKNPRRQSAQVAKQSIKGHKFCTV